MADNIYNQLFPIGSPFFIVASPRSGTTLLERMLNRHPEVFIPPETAFFFLLKQYGFLDRLYDLRMAEKAVKFYLTRKPARLLKLDEVDGIKEKMLLDADSFVDIFVNLLGILAGDTECSIIGEKTPHHLRCIDFILKNFPGSPIIAVVRDGRAVVKSHVKHPNWENNILAAAEAWKNDALRLQMLLSEACSRRVHLILYEQLLEEPDTELGRLCEFLGLKFQKSMLDSTLDTPVRFNDYYQQAWMAKSVNSIDPTRMHSWKKEYRQDELALVEYVIGEELRSFGYAVDRRQGEAWKLLWFKEWMRHKWCRMRVRLANKHTGVISIK